MDEFRNVSGESIMYSFYTRYDRLKDITIKELGHSNADHAILIIDAVSMIKSIYSLSSNNFSNMYSIAAGILNAAAHYRNFYRTRFNVSTDIYIIFSKSEKSIEQARTMCKDYSNYFMMNPNQILDSILKMNLEFIQKICPYLGHVRYVESHYEPMVVAHKIITQEKSRIQHSKNDSDIPAIIVTKDVLMYQLVSVISETYILRPLKAKDEDLSYYINKDNVIDSYMMMRHTKSTEPFIGKGELFPFVLASTRLPERNIKSLHNMNGIINALKSIDEDITVFNSSEYICDKLSKYTKTKLDAFAIDLRMKAFGIKDCIFRYASDPIQDDIDMINLFNPDMVKQINERYFANNPLDLMSF